METINKEGDLPQNIVTQAVTLSETAQCLAGLQLNEETGNIVRKTQYEAVLLQEVGPVGITILDNLSNMSQEDAMLYIVCQISEFHELVNQKLIQDRRLTVLIQVIGNLVSVGSYLELQTHIIRIVTNPHFLDNIFRYMTQSLAPKVDPLNPSSVHGALSTGGKTSFTVECALKHLLAYFTFVQINMKEFSSVQFTESSNFLLQLLDGKKRCKAEAQQSINTNFGYDFEKFQLNSVNSTATTCLLKTPFLYIVYWEEPSEAIKMVYNRRHDLCALANSNFNLFVQILASKICGMILDSNVRILQAELVILITTPNFLQQLSNHLTTVIARLRKGTALESTAECYKSQHLRSIFEVFEEVLQYCLFLVTEEIHEFIPAAVYYELDTCVRAANDLQLMCTRGEILAFSKEHHTHLNMLKHLYDDTAGLLKDYLSYLKTTKKSKAHAASSSSDRIRLQAQKAKKATQQEQLLNLNIDSRIGNIPITITSSPLVKPTADVLTADNLTQICRMPVDQVFNLLCSKRRNFVEFITRKEISHNQLNLIAVIWSTYLNRPAFENFRKYLFSILIEDAFLIRLFDYTRQRARDLRERKTQSYSSTTEFYGSLFTLYNLLWIHSESKPESEEFSTQLLKRNIRSVYDQLGHVTVAYPKNKKILFNPSILAALLRFSGRFRDLAESTKDGTVGK